MRFAQPDPKFEASMFFRPGLFGESLQQTPTHTRGTESSVLKLLDLNFEGACCQQKANLEMGFGLGL